MTVKVEGDPGYSGMAASEKVPLIIPDQEPHLHVWKPLTREDLSQAAGGPDWKKFRSRLVLLFWLGWLAVLGAAVIVITRSPWTGAPAMHWWQTEVFYRLQPALLLDAENTGPSALNKVSDRFPYLKSLGIRVVILKGLFRRDVSPLNLTEIDQKLGTLAEFHQLITDSHKTGVKLILDLCELDLFNRTEFRNKANTSVYVENGLRYWREQGVSGFEICVTDLESSEEMLREWTRLDEVLSTKDNKWTVVLRQTDDYSPGFSVWETAFNSSLVNTLLSKPLLPTSSHPLPAAELAEAVQARLKTLQADWVSWTVDGAVGEDLKKVTLVLIMTLPGTPIITYGDEISETRDNQRKKSRALFRSLSRTRAREEALLFGSFTFLPLNNTSLSPSPTNSPDMPLLAFLRSLGCVHVLVLLNFGSETLSLEPNWAPSLPEGGVFVTSTGLDRFGSVSLQSINLHPREAIIIKLFDAHNRD